MTKRLDQDPAHCCRDENSYRKVLNVCVGSSVIHGHTSTREVVPKRP